MENLQIKFSTTGKAVSPRPIRLQVPGWGGSPDRRMENGSEPQPWHCPPFVEGAAYGLELIYHYKTECHVINDDGNVRFEWDSANEPGGITGPDEFGVFAPRPNKFYFFASLIDIQAPEGYVIRTEPHARFYTDDTGTVPAAVSGHVQTHWWPKKLFVVFKAPRIGERHIFRMGEPYVQLLCVPQNASYELTPMTEAENEKRRDAEKKIGATKSFIAKATWQNSEGAEFNDHYRTLARAVARDGTGALENQIEQAIQRLIEVVPPGKSVQEYLALEYDFQRQGKLLEARELLFRVRQIDPQNPEAASRLGIIAATMQLPELAAQMMSQAVALRPQNAVYHNNLGVALRKLKRFAEAEASFRASLELNPTDPLLRSNLGLTLAEQGRIEEGVTECRAAAALNPGLPAVQLRMGMVLKMAGDLDASRACFENSLSIDPNFSLARRALQELDAAP